MRSKSKSIVKHLNLDVVRVVEDGLVAEFVEVVGAVANADSLAYSRRLLRWWRDLKIIKIKTMRINDCELTRNLSV
jgi:hypothetical protein